MSTVTFADLDGKTLLTVRQALEPTAAKDVVKRERQAARAGWAETLDRLDEYVGEDLLMWRLWRSPRACPGRVGALRVGTPP
jgi:Activator of Hsp90 ATPase homolog 1-like protein